MEIKKSIEADLERDKSNFVLMGLLIAVCAIFIAFEWAQRDLKPITSQDAIAEVEADEEVAPISEQNTPPPPPPPPAPEPVIEQAPTEFKKNENATEKVKVADSDDTNKETENAKQIINDPTPPPEEPDNDNTIYMKVQQKAEYPGGTAALAAFLSKNLVYPKSAAETGTQGKVIVQFTVEKNGTVTDVEVVRSIDPALDKEAMRVVKMMSGWKPAKNGTKNVRSKFRLPVSFTLN